MPPRLSSASSSVSLASGNWPWRRAAAAVRYCQRTFSRGGGEEGGARTAHGHGQHLTLFLRSETRRGGSPVSGVLQALLFDFRRVHPHDVAGAGVQKLEGVEDVIAGAGAGAGGHALEF